MRGGRFGSNRSSLGFLFEGVCEEGLRKEGQRRGGYAITPPLSISFEQNFIIAQLNYAIYNKVNVLQWLLRFH